MQHNESAESDQVRQIGCGAGHGEHRLRSTSERKGLVGQGRPCSSPKDLCNKGSLLIPSNQLLGLLERHVHDRDYSHERCRVILMSILSLLTSLKQSFATSLYVHVVPLRGTILSSSWEGRTSMIASSSHFIS